MTDRYRAIIADTPGDSFNQTVTMYLAEQVYGKGSALTSDGTWKQYEEGGTVEGAGIAIPRGMVEALYEACERFLGKNVNHAATEASVLREWLKVEQERVERILTR